MRRLLFVVLAALAITGAALADPLDPKVAYTSADQARAKAAVLQQSDLGIGWVNNSSTEAPSLKAPICPSLRPNYSKLTITGHAESVFDNGNGGYQVTSDAEVWKTASQAAQHMNALLKPALPTCIRYSLLKSVGGASNITLRDPKPRFLGKIGGSVPVSYRVPVAIKDGSKTLILNADYIFLRKGRMEVYINVIAPSDDEASLLAFEKRVARTLAARMRS
jgi:hypothetical protein